MFNAKNFNPHKKPISLLNLPICTQGMQRTWWPEAGTIIVTGSYCSIITVTSNECEDISLHPSLNLDSAACSGWQLRKPHHWSFVKGIHRSLEVLLTKVMTVIMMPPQNKTIDITSDNRVYHEVESLSPFISTKTYHYHTWYRRDHLR